MKKYFIVIGISSLLGLAACQKLDREFVTTIGSNEIEQSLTNVQSLLNSIYSDLPDGTTYLGNAWMMASATDEAEFTNETSAVQNFNTGSWNAISNPDNVWGTYYRGIRKVNQFLLSTGKINLDPWKLDPSPSAQSVYTTNLALIDRWKYEARLLRAYFYFELIKRYGGVPIINNVLSLDEDFSKIQRNSLDSCVKFIANECDSAALKLPLNASTAPYVNTNDLGRVTKLSALALKSRLLLYAASDLFNMPASWAGGYSNVSLISLPATVSRSDRWKAASDAALAVINASTLPTLGSYKALFNTFNNGEIILARSNAASNQFERNNSPISFTGATANANTPSQDLVDAYEVKVNATTSVAFDWNNPAHAAAPYANRDPRLDFTVILNNTTFGTPSKTVQPFNSGADGKPTPFATKTGYYLRKYQIESLNISSGNTGVHAWILFRYPEIYLNYAEALNEWNPTSPDIKNYYDRVRSRATMPGLSTTLNQNDVRDKIRNERRVELAFEDHRFWDVRRWLLGTTFFNAPLRGVDINRTSIAPLTFTYTPIIVENRSFQPKMYLYPIPQADININASLAQNPLW